MFDITSSKLLILGIIALIVVGPKELPVLLRTIGKYLAMVRRQANEFKAQFDDAMRESELDKLRKDVEKVGQDAESSIRDTERNLNDEIARTNSAIETDVTMPIEHATAIETPPLSIPAPTLAEPVPLTSEAIANAASDVLHPAPHAQSVAAQSVAAHPVKVGA